MANLVEEEKDYLDMAIVLKAIPTAAKTNPLSRVRLSKLSSAVNNIADLGRHITEEFSFQLPQNGDDRFSIDLLHTIQRNVSVSISKVSLHIHRPGNIRALHHIIADFYNRTVATFEGGGVQYEVDVNFYDNLVDTDDERDDEMSVFGTGGEYTFFDAAFDLRMILNEMVERLREREGVEDGACCSICLMEFDGDGDQIEEKEGMELVRTACSHVFHYQCLARWFEKRQACPMCRAPMISS